MSHPAQHINQAVKFQKEVLLVGTANVTYRQGEGVAYNRDYGTATTAEPSRDKRVEPVSATNHMHFAGVLDHDVTLPSTGQKWVTINEPGSVCYIALGADTVIDSTILGCQAGGGTGAGRFSDKGFIGRGAAKALQTVTGVLESVKDGTGSLATDGVTLTVADSSDMSAGDTVVFLASEDEGSSKTITLGKYTIASITNATTIVLSSSAVAATPGAALLCSYYIYTGQPRALAQLLDGPPGDVVSGCVQWIQPPNAGGDNLGHMVGGISYVGGSAQGLSADSECELANGSNYGHRKSFVVMGTQTTNDFVVDLVVAGVQRDGSSALAEINAMDAAGDACHLQWDGVWRCLSVAGGATEA